MHEYHFKKGEKVIKILSVFGMKSATLQIVGGVKNHHVYGKVTQLEDSSSTYDQYGREVGGVLPGCSNEIVPLDGDEEDHMRSMLMPTYVKKPVKRAAKPKKKK